MANGAAPRIRGRFGDLTGESLLSNLVERGNWTGLELLWRASEPELAVRIAPLMAASGEPKLADLLVSELLAPTMTPATLQQPIFTAIEQRWPLLSSRAIAELDAALHDPSNGCPAIAARRDLLEVLLLKQRGKIADEFALWVISGGHPSPIHGLTMNASIARCADDPSVRARAAAEYLRQLVAQPDMNSWNRAADFIEQTCPKDERQKAVLELMEELVRSTPAIVVSGPFQPVIGGLIKEHGGRVLKALFEGDPLDQTAGVKALLDLVEDMSNAKLRLEIFVLVLRRQMPLWPLIAPIATNWDEDRWQEVLDTLDSLPDDKLPAQLHLLFAAAPPEHSARMMEMTARHSKTDDTQLVTTVRQQALVLYQHISGNNAALPHLGLEELAAPAPVCGALWWPDERDEVGLSLLADVLSSFGSPADQVRVVVEAYDLGRASAVVIAAALPEAQIHNFVVEKRKTNPPAGREIRPVLKAIMDVYPNRVLESASIIQSQGFDLDIAAVVAPLDPGIAFSRADAAYDGLDDDAREELLGLLEAHGGRNQAAVIARFASSVAKPERARRARAITLFGRVGASGDVPQFIRDGLKVPDAAVSKAAFAAVAALCPLDRDFLRELRSVAQGDGAAASQAGKTLDELSAKHLEMLSHDASDTEKRDLLLALGAAARPAATDVLLGHLGDADSDSPEIHLAASEAVLEATPFVDMSDSQMTRLSDLLDGDAQENDPAVRLHLRDALARASLGENDALDLLYEEIAYRPNALPETMFGPERPTLLRQLALFKRERDRGSVGWANALAHLDNVAERIVRATYLQHGNSEALKRRIEASPRDPDYGALLQAAEGKLIKAKAPLTELHRIRSEETEVPHPGQPTTEATWNHALESFKAGAKICIALLNTANP